MSDRPQDPTDAIEIELIRSLYDAFVPSLIMSAGFIICGGLIVLQSGDPLLTAMLGGGVLASLARLLVAWRDSRKIGASDIAIHAARRLERRFGAAYFAFAAMLGIFSARAFQLPLGNAHMLTICLLIGYGAGVAAGIGLRPHIAIPSIVIAVIPAQFISLTYDDILYRASAAMAVAFVAGGIFSLHGRHRRALADIGRRLTFAALARHDGLTTLPNRLGLREWFEQAGSGAPVAVHCLDLDGFKPVNDSYGHPTGDALLAAVAGRIAMTIRTGDIAARLGGDEFVVIQRGIAHPEEAELFAQRLRAIIGRPYSIHGHDISISSCIGYVVSSTVGSDLEQLIGLADAALYKAKRGDRGIHRHEAETQRIAAA